MGTINHALPDIITLSLAFLIISCTLDDPVQFTLTASFNEESHQSTPQVLRAENRALILIIQTQLNDLSVFVFGLILMHGIFVPPGRFIITFIQRAYSHHSNNSSQKTQMNYFIPGWLRCLILIHPSPNSTSLFPSALLSPKKKKPSLVPLSINSSASKKTNNPFTVLFSLILLHSTHPCCLFFFIW